MVQAKAALASKEVMLAPRSELKSYAELKDWLIKAGFEPNHPDPGSA